MPADTEWIRRTLAHEDTGAVPYNFKCTPDALRRAQEHYGTPLEDAIGLPMRFTGTGTIKPLYADPDKYGPTLADEFGVVWTTQKLDRGSPLEHPLREASLDGYTFPDPAEEYRYEQIGEWCKRNSDHFRMIWVGDLWERATFMRGMENILLDVALNPAFVEELILRLEDYIQGTMDILLDRFEFEGIAVSDDYGSQNSLMISPDDWRHLIKPSLARIYAKAKTSGRIVYHHTCGHVTPIVRDMIDIGLDILHPIQPEAMDILALKKEYGRDVSFCGGFPTQHLLTNGTPEEVRAEVRRLKELMGAGGGFILETGITIQADVPTENIVALVDEARLTT